MSTYWYLYCRTCDVGDADRVGWWNHGVDRGLRDLIASLPALAGLRDVGNMVNVQIVGPENTSGIVDFAADHATHEVVCKNEYGAFDDQCAEHYGCQSCGASLCCRLDKGHDGVHGQNRRST